MFESFVHSTEIFKHLLYVQGIVLGAGCLGDPLAALWKLFCKSLGPESPWSSVVWAGVWCSGEKRRPPDVG